MSKNNNLLEIADLLIKIKAERELHENEISPSIKARYPKSRGIYIDGDKYIVVNSEETTTQKDESNEIKDKGAKYNLDFYLSTHSFNEPNIIDEEHNKGKLINLAYSEVSFLTKDIESQTDFNPEVAKDAVRKSIIDITDKEDFDSFVVSETDSFRSKEYDEVYRCRCIFTDISGNEMTESLFIKAAKIGKNRYKYEVIDSGDIKDQVARLEKGGAENQKKSSYSTISADEYNKIKEHIRDGIEEYYQKNDKKFFRLIRVDVKAIYCLRLQKLPIKLSLKKDGNEVGYMSSYFSTVAGDFNIFSCPVCGAASLPNGEGIKIHLDHDFIESGDYEEGDADDEYPIGCTECMEKCRRCGKWHFKLGRYNDIDDDAWRIKDSRYFLKKYVNSEVFHSADFCSCCKYLTWIYDEMSRKDSYKSDFDNKQNKRVKKLTQWYYEDIINDFLSTKDKLVFVNYSTGEMIAGYNDFVSFFHDYMLNKVDKEIKDLYKNVISTDISENIEERINYFVQDPGDKYELIREAVKQCIEQFKRDLSNAFNIPLNLIKVTSKDNMKECACCHGWYYIKENTQKETYYNNVRNFCWCCSEGLNARLKIWERPDDGVTFYRPSLKKEEVVRTFQSKNEEEFYSKWVRRTLNSIAKKKKLETEKEEKRNGTRR